MNTRPADGAQIDKYRKGWSSGLPETPCGHGSRIGQTEIQRKALTRWVSEYNISTLVDVGAGDLNWIRQIEWPRPVAYVPLDLVPRHPDVREFDLLREVPPAADMILCIWVLNHLPEAHSRMALANLLAAKSRWLVYTWWPQMFGFLDLGFDETVVLRKHHGVNLELRLARNV